MASSKDSTPIAKAAVPYRGKDLLALSIWYGLATGILEGASLLILQQANLLTWNVKVNAVNQNILWASPIMDVILFFAAGIALLIAFAIYRPSRWLFLSNLLFGAMCMFSLISVAGRVRERGAIMLALGLAAALARTISQQTIANMKQNLGFAFVYNALGVPLAAGVLYPFTGLLLSPMIAALAMSLSSVSVIGNALRLRAQ